MPTPRLLLSNRRRPPHPGHFLLTRFLRPAGISQEQLALRLGVSRQRVSELVRGRRAISADTAIRLALLFDTEPTLWTGLQAAWDVDRGLRRLRLSAKQLST